MNKERNSSFAESLIRGLEEGIQYTKGDIELNTVSHSLMEPIVHIDSDEIYQIRKRVGLSKSHFAKVLNVSDKTLRNWENGTQKPSRPAIRLLQIIGAQPQILGKGIKTSRNKKTKISVKETVTKEV